MAKRTISAIMGLLAILAALAAAGYAVELLMISGLFANNSGSIWQPKQCGV
jgi:hypothetical protein